MKGANIQYVLLFTQSQLQRLYDLTSEAVRNSDVTGFPELKTIKDKLEEALERIKR
jgi:hypothetical protein